MTENKKSYVPPEVLQRMELGRQKKLWSLEVEYALDGERKILRKRNLTGEEVLKLRTSMFQCGFTMPVGEHHWRIIPPIDMVRMDLYQQSAYFAE